MFGRSRPVVFDPYGSRRRRRVPAWLVTAVAGIAVGAGGVLYVQERYLPPRLSVDQSAKLQALAERTEKERKRLEGELAEQRTRLQAELTEQRDRLEVAAAAEKKLSAELLAARKSAEQLRADVAALVQALPPDPRGGAIAVRAASFEHENTSLAYSVVLTREARDAKPFTGVMQFVVAGSRASGSEANLTLGQLELGFARYDSVEGSLPLPEGFVPRQVTVRILDRAGGQQLGMRVLYVK